MKADVAIMVGLAMIAPAVLIEVVSLAFGFQPVTPGEWLGIMLLWVAFLALCVYASRD